MLKEGNNKKQTRYPASPLLSTGREWREDSRHSGIKSIYNMCISRLLTHIYKEKGAGLE